MRVAFATAILLPTAGCERADTGSVRTTRLVELLHTASIDSPLQSIRAANTIDELGDVAHETVFLEDFESFDPQAAGWRTSKRTRIVPTETGRSLALRGHPPGAEGYGWYIPAKPGTHYVFERRAQPSGPMAADFVVVETREKNAAGRRGHYMPGRGGALKIHWPTRSDAPGPMQTDSVSFFTTHLTRWLSVEVRPTRSRHQGDSRHTTRFDDIRVSELAPTPEQTMALLKARSAADGADPQLGIAKFGQFPPLGEIRHSHSPDESNFSFRTALYAPAPTDIAFPLSIPTGASLAFSYCLSRETRLGHGAHFEVLVRAGGREQVVWSRALAAIDGSWRWEEGRADLSAFSDRDVEVILRTRPMRGNPQSVWGNPVLDYPAKPAGPQNVILIAADTLRADRLSCYGYDKPTSPNLDALAGDGVRFEQCIANSNWTCPSFASIFTGVVPSRHGVLSFGARTPLPSAFETLAERFRAQGWSTYSIAYKSPLYDGGFDQGFDVSFNVPREYVRCDDNVTEALHWLETNARRRNFLFLHFNDPHQPFNQPAPYDSSFGPHPSELGIELPVSLHEDVPERESERDVMRNLYDGEIAYVDDRIGMFLDELKERGLYDDAVIVFVSDHGEQLWEHGAFGHGPDFTGKSTFLYDEVVRVPLIVKPGSGAFARGGVVSTQVRAFDVMPTLLELAGLPAEEELDARSLASMLTANSGASPDRTAVTESSGRALALREGGWKYILTWDPQRPRAELLFHLEGDPGEAYEVSGQHPEIVERMRLRALDYILANQPGRYLVAIGTESPAQFRFGVAGPPSVLPVFGVPFEPGSAPRIAFRGIPTSPVAMVALVEGAEPIELSRTQLPHHESRPYEAGELLRLVSERVEGFHEFTTAHHQPPRPADSQTIDARQLRALRALGYLEGPELSPK